MRIVDKSNPNPPRVFFFNSINEKDGWVKLRHPNKKFLDDLNAKTVIEKPVFRRGQRIIERIPDEERQNELLWDYEIVDWLVYEKNEAGEVVEMTLTLENKVYMMLEEAWFSSVVIQGLDEILQGKADREEDEEKNSRNSPAPSPLRSTARRAKNSEETTKPSAGNASQ